MPNELFRNPYNHRIIVKSFILPAVLVTYGFFTFGNNTLKTLNTEIKEEIWTENHYRKTRMDDYLLFLPATSVYGLDAIGIHSKNNFRDRTMIYLLSNILVTSSVFSLKK